MSTIPGFYEVAIRLEKYVSCDCRGGQAVRD